MRLLITIDTEASRKVIVDGRMRHLDYTAAIEEPVLLLLKVGATSGLHFTFFLPLGELLPDYPQVMNLGEQILNQGHDVQAHRHMPFPKLSESQIIDSLSNEVELFNRYTGHRPHAIRAGGYSVGLTNKWIRSILACGFRIDSSVWSGANTNNTRLIIDQQTATEEDWWGPGALGFDFRDAPIGGAYFCSPDNLARIGDSPLLEIPISMRDYDEPDAWQYKFDPQWQDGPTLCRMFESFAAAERTSSDLIINMAWHSAQAQYWNTKIQNAIPLTNRTKYPLRALRAFTYFAHQWQSNGWANKAESICLRDIDPDALQPCVLWGRHQLEYWVSQPSIRRNDISVSVSWKNLGPKMRCPLCGFVGLQIRINSMICPTCQQEYPVLEDIPILLRDARVSFEESVAPSKQVPRKTANHETLWTKIRRQPPVTDLFSQLVSLRFLVTDLLPSLIVVVLAVMLTPLAIISWLANWHQTSRHELSIPPQQTSVRLLPRVTRQVGSN